MKVLVFGNVGSGKTTLIESLQKLLPYKKIVIDDYRRKFGDGSKEAELITREKFFEAVNLDENQYVECTGVGEVADKLYSLFEGSIEQVICVILLTPKEICKKRLITRTWDIPFPKPIGEVSSFIDRTEIKIKAGEVKTQWGKRNNTLLTSYKNIERKDIETISRKVLYLIRKIEQLNRQDFTEVQQMLDEDCQKYYGNHYLKYQKKINEQNEQIVEDRIMVERFISGLNLNKTIVDIGAGNCQWFSSIEKNINFYYAVDANKMALSFSPKSNKLKVINCNVFDDKFTLSNLVQHPFNYCILSFFLSHFSDTSINTLLNKLKSIKSLLIIDTYWNDIHKKKYVSKQLKQVVRRTSDNTEIILPKRFFEFSDLEIIAVSFGYSITDFKKGEYWFACLMQR